MHLSISFYKKIIINAFWRKCQITGEIFVFYNNLKTICDNQGIKITPFVKECGGSTGSINQWKNGASPNSDIVIKLAKRLNVSTDYLLTGKEFQAAPELTKIELECLDKFNVLTEMDKGRILDRMQTMYEAYDFKEKGK